MISNSFLDGQGELVNVQGDRYLGEFVNGKRQGQGEMAWTNGDRYVGEWKNDNMNGMESLVAHLAPGRL